MTEEQKIVGETHKATGTGTPTRWLEHEKQWALRPMLHNFCSRNPWCPLHCFLPSYCGWPMGTANKSLSRLCFTLSPPYAQNYFSKQAIHWMRSLPRSSVSVIDGKRDEATRSTTSPDTAGAAGSALLPAGPASHGSQALGTPSAAAARAAIATCCWKRGPGAGRSHGVRGTCGKKGLARLLIQPSGVGRCGGEEGSRGANRGTRVRRMTEIGRAP